MNKMFLMIAAVVVIIVGGLVSSYNGLVTMDENVSGKWAQIDTQLQRRNDLIPNLINTVKGYAAHEEGVFKYVTDARAKLVGAKSVEDKAQADAELTNALSRLMLVVENYPMLKSDANFRALQDELAGTENRIAVARKDYNDSVQQFNGAIRSFPTSAVAGMFGFEKHEYFKAERAAKNVPKVTF